MTATETKATNRKTNEECYRRGYSDGMQSCRDVLAARELDFFRRASAAHAEGNKDEAAQFFKDAKAVSAAILSLSATPPGPSA